MENFFKYLTIADEDIEWGLFINSAGKEKVLPGSNYPPAKQPSGYYFNWSNGRVLQEYQIIYITEGEGILENKEGKIKIKPGSLIIVSPDYWHRYRPLKAKGWTELYIGFNGNIAKRLLQNPLFNKKLVYVGIKEELLDSYFKIFDLVKNERPGYQQVSSGMIVKLLGYIVSHEKQKEFSGKRITTIIEESKFRIRQDITSDLNIQEFCKEMAIGYSYFRRMFKNYTGISPHQYQIQLKLISAKELIISTDKSLKEISYELGFDSIQYFSRLFKKKTGINPSELRK